jgi:hypothetical protein
MQDDDETPEQKDEFDRFIEMFKKILRDRVRERAIATAEWLDSEDEP